MTRWAKIKCPHCKETIELYTIHQIKIFKQWRRRESGASGETDASARTRQPAAAKAPSLPPEVKIRKEWRKKLQGQA